MNKKKLIITGCAVVLLGVVITLIAVFSGGAAVKTGGEYSMKASVKNDTVKVKLSGGKQWEATTPDSENVAITRNSARSFTVKLNGRYSGAVAFVLEEEDVFFSNSLELLYDGSGEIDVKPGYCGAASENQSLAEDTELPFEAVIEGDCVKITYKENASGIWKTDAPEGIYVSGKITDNDGTHFTVYAQNKGEYTVTFTNETAGLVSTIVFVADDGLNISIKSAETGTSEKVVPDVKKESKKKK